MPVNPYLNNFYAANEQKLIDNLSVEFIQFHGIDCLYLKRNVTREEKILHEDRLATFNEAVNLEFYVKNVEGFGGDGDMLSKFGLNISDNMTLTVSITRCKEVLGINRRPMEGDLIYFPLNKKMFEVMHNEHESVFYQNGALQFYDLRVELFEFSNETFATGNAIIDELYSGMNSSTPEAIDDLRSVDPIADNEIIQDFTDGILDFSEMDPYSNEGKW
jgi:hypothetical protein